MLPKIFLSTGTRVRSTLPGHTPNINDLPHTIGRDFSSQKQKKRGDQACTPGDLDLKSPKGCSFIQTSNRHNSTPGYMCLKEPRKYTFLQTATAINRHRILQYDWQ